jgi:hypothetical protein
MSMLLLATLDPAASQTRCTDGCLQRAAHTQKRHSHAKRQKEPRLPATTAQGKTDDWRERAFTPDGGGGGSGGGSGGGM